MFLCSLKPWEALLSLFIASQQTLEKAVRMDPLFVIAKLDLARYYNHHGNEEKAEQLFEEALEVHPDSFDGHIHYREFLYEKVFEFIAF